MAKVLSITAHLNELVSILSHRKAFIETYQQQHPDDRSETYLNY